VLIWSHHDIAFIGAVADGAWQREYLALTFSSYSEKISKIIVIINIMF